MIRSTVSGTAGSGGATACRPVFEIEQRHDADGALRVTLIGELDLAVADQFRARLAQLSRSEQRVRLDLSRLEFIDCCGIRGILGALADARHNRLEFEVDRLVSPSVGRIAALAEVDSVLWPPESGSSASR